MQIQSIHLLRQVCFLIFVYSCTESVEEISTDGEYLSNYLDAKVQINEEDMQVEDALMPNLAIDMEIDFEFDMGVETVMIRRDECVAQEFTWIDHLFNINPTELTPNASLLTRYKSYIDCASEDAHIYAILTNLSSSTLTDSLIAAAQAGILVHLILINPQEDLLTKLRTHLSNEVYVCPATGCVVGKTIQESNILLISKLQISSGEREGTVVTTSDPLLEQSEPGKLYDLFARHEDLNFYQKMKEQWQQIKQGMFSGFVRAEHYLDANTQEHLLWTSLDIHATEYHLNNLLASYSRCEFRAINMANFFIISPELTNEQMFLIDHINRLGANCSFKFLVNRISPELAQELGDQVRVSNHVEFGFSAVIGDSTVNILDNVQHQEVYTGTRSWLSSQNNYEGGIFWAWNQDLKDAYLNPMWGLWQSAQAP